MPTSHQLGLREPYIRLRFIDIKNTPWKNQGVQCKFEEWAVGNRPN